jgi:hypothetical protein
MGHPVVSAHRICLHQRHDHEATAEGKRADLEGRPCERIGPAGLGDGGEQRPNVKTNKLSGEASQHELNRAAREQDEHEPGASHSGGSSAGQRIREHPHASCLVRAKPDRKGDAEAGSDCHGSNCCAGAHTGSAYPRWRRAREEHGRERKDQDQAGHDEPEAPDDRALRTAQTPWRNRSRAVSMPAQATDSSRRSRARTAPRSTSPGPLHTAAETARYALEDPRSR